MKKLLILPCLFLFLFSCDSDDDDDFGIYGEWEPVKIDRKEYRNGVLQYENSGELLMGFCDYTFSIDENRFCNDVENKESEGCGEYVDDRYSLIISEKEFSLIFKLDRERLLYDAWSGCSFFRKDNYTETDQGTPKIDYENQKIAVKFNSLRYTDISIVPERYESPFNNDTWDELNIEDNDYIDGEKVVEYNFELTENGELILQNDIIFPSEPETTYSYTWYYIKK